MIKTRVIPILLLQDGLLKKPVNFKNPRTIANPIAIARVFEARQVDELVMLDIGSTARNSNVNPDIVRMVAEELTVPFACGGGVRSVKTIGQLISAGAEKIVINSAALELPGLIKDGAARFGSQCILVSIDAKRTDDGEYRVFSRNGSEPMEWTAVDWAKRAEELGAGEILLNSIDEDGRMEGYDIELVRQVSHAVDLPVIAAGGAGTADHFPPVVIDGGAAAVAAGSIFHYTKITPNMVKKAMADRKIPVRLADHDVEYIIQ
jgi:imidazole glycerol-phosphate synthase subunit HisF